MKENFENVVRHLEERIRALEDVEENQGGFNLEDEVDIQLYTQLEMMKDILKMLTKGV